MARAFAAVVAAVVAVLSYYVLVVPQPAPPNAIPHNTTFGIRPWYYDERSPASLKGSTCGELAGSL